MRAQGKTLLEMLVTLGLIAILSAVATPQLSQFLHEQRLRSATDNLYHALYATRYEAAVRQQRISLWNQHGNWGGELEMFVDSDGSGKRESGEPLLRSISAPADGLSISGNNSVSDYVSYMPDGRALTKNGAFQAGTLQLCQPGHQGVYRIVLSIGGRLRRAHQAEISCEL